MASIVIGTVENQQLFVLLTLFFRCKKKTCKELPFTCEIFEFIIAKGKKMQFYIKYIHKSVIDCLTFRILHQACNIMGDRSMQLTFCFCRSNKNELIKMHYFSVLHELPLLPSRIKKKKTF